MNLASYCFLLISLSSCWQYSRQNTKPYHIRHSHYQFIHSATAVGLKWIMWMPWTIWLSVSPQECRTFEDGLERDNAWSVFIGCNSSPANALVTIVFAARRNISDSDPAKIWMILIPSPSSRRRSTTMKKILGTSFCFSLLLLQAASLEKERLRL